MTLGLNAILGGRLLVPAVVLCLAGTLGVAAPAASTPEWVPPETVGSPSSEENGDLTVDVNAHGLALLAWGSRAPRDPQPYAVEA